MEDLSQSPDPREKEQCYNTVYTRGATYAFIKREQSTYALHIYQCTSLDQSLTNSLKRY